MSKKSKYSDIFREAIGADSEWSRNTNASKFTNKNGASIQQMLGIEDEGPTPLPRATGLTLMGILDMMFTKDEIDQEKEEEEESDEP